jgi:hypothetical protein
MEIWKIQSNSGKQIALSVVMAAAGLFVAYSFRNFSGPGFTNSLAGFLLGLLLLLTGVVSLLATGRQTITVDPGSQSILVEDWNLFGKRERSFAFGDIIDMRVAKIGKASNYTFTYYVSLHLADGSTYPLFLTAYYDGRWDRAEAEERCQKLKSYLQI